MKGKIAKVLLVLLFLFVAVTCYSEELPEFTGNYIECGGKWCEMKNTQLNDMMIQETSPAGLRFITYNGFFNIPKTAVRLNTRRPRILLNSGRPQGDPATTALVELTKLPYNNEPIYEVDRQSYEGKIRYCKQNAKYRLWVFKREIPLRFKPVEGKVGMYIYQPEEPLADGFYVIDVGTPQADGHQGLSTQPGYFDFYSISHVMAAVPFIIGNVKDDASLEKDSGEETKSNDKRESSAKSLNEEANDVGKALGNAIKNLFGK